jgi:hypothetical protein
MLRLQIFRSACSLSFGEGWGEVSIAGKCFLFFKVLSFLLKNFLLLFLLKSLFPPFLLKEKVEKDCPKKSKKRVFEKKKAMQAKPYPPLCKRRESRHFTAKRTIRKKKRNQPCNRAYKIYKTKKARITADLLKQDMWTVSTEALNAPAFAKAIAGECGEYRSRTDDLLHAMQAL